MNIKRRFMGDLFYAGDIATDILDRKDSPNSSALSVRADFDALNEIMDQLELLSWRGAPQFLPSRFEEGFKRLSLGGANFLGLKNRLQVLPSLLQIGPLAVQASGVTLGAVETLRAESSQTEKMPRSRHDLFSRSGYVIPEESMGPPPNVV